MNHFELFTYVGKVLPTDLHRLTTTILFEDLLWMQLDLTLPPTHPLTSRVELFPVIRFNWATYPHLMKIFWMRMTNPKKKCQMMMWRPKIIRGGGGKDLESRASGSGTAGRAGGLVNAGGEASDTRETCDRQGV